MGKKVDVQQAIKMKDDEFVLHLPMLKNTDVHMTAIMTRIGDIKNRDTREQAIRTIGSSNREANMRRTTVQR